MEKKRKKQIKKKNTLSFLISHWGVGSHFVIFIIFLTIIKYRMQKIKYRMQLLIFKSAKWCLSLYFGLNVWRKFNVRSRVVDALFISIAVPVWSWKGLVSDCDTLDSN